jgi:hypothetical protein
MTPGDYDGQWVVSREPALRGYQVEWVEDDELLLSRRNQLFATQAPGSPIRRVATFPAPAWKRTAARLRPIQRLLRFLFYNVLKLPDGRLFASFDKSIGILDGDRFTLLQGLVRPCRILRSSCALASDGKVYFGEYISNDERGPIHVYCYAPGSSRVEVVHTFPADGVRHVHGIFRDPWSSALWCVTGDVKHECRIMRTFDEFQTIETVGAGDESWRSVSLAFTESHVYYATDAQFIRNRVLRLDRSSWKREVLGEMDGPVFFCRAVAGDLFFVVGAELCPSQIGQSASLVHVSGAGRPATVVSFPKDRFNVDYFMFGTLSMPQGPWLPDRFYFHGIGLRGADNETFVVRRRANTA